MEVHPNACVWMSMICRHSTLVKHARAACGTLMQHAPMLRLLCDAGRWLSVMRKDGRIHLYDALRVDCHVRPSREFRVPSPVTFRSTTSLSADAQWLAATSAHGSTYVFNVRTLMPTCCAVARVMCGTGHISAMMCGAGRISTAASWPACERGRAAGGQHACGAGGAQRAWGGHHWPCGPRRGHWCGLGGARKRRAGDVPHRAPAASVAQRGAATTRAQPCTTLWRRALACVCCAQVPRRALRAHHACRHCGALVRRLSGATGHPCAPPCALGTAAQPAAMHAAMHVANARGRRQRFCGRVRPLRVTRVACFACTRSAQQLSSAHDVDAAAPRCVPLQHALGSPPAAPVCPRSSASRRMRRRQRRARRR
jgi:hypothetical protein